MSDGESIEWLSKEQLFSCMPRLAADMKRDYYVTDDWSLEFYVLQAVRGFIAVSYQGIYILPQLQRSYCILEFRNLNISKKLRKHINEYTLRMNTKFSQVLTELNQYHHNSWLSSKYQALSLCMHQKGLIILNIGTQSFHFRFVSVELYKEETLVAGEIGYVIGSTYTSLSGFCRREKNVSVGKIQLIKLAQFLESHGFDFLNLGQPPAGPVMQYKADLGGVEVSRVDFLNKWNQSIERSLMI